MRSPISRFLTETDMEKITSAVKEAEKRTSCEIVPMITQRSDSYTAANGRGAFFISMALALIICIVLKAYSIKIFLPIFFGSIFIFYFIIDRAAFLKRLFVFEFEMGDEVADAALASFYDNGLHRTREENGLLIFISIFEKKAWILADRGIDEKVKRDEWEKIMADMTSGIKKGAQREAIISAVDSASFLLSKVFPPLTDDVNELEDLIIKTE